MKELYHVGISAGGPEVLFRTNDDYDYAFNCLAIALYKTGSDLFCDSFMSTHCHWVVQTENLGNLTRYFKNSYTHYFNNKYLRKGNLIDSQNYSIILKGIYHVLAAESYVLRNCMHHGICRTPFAYRHTSANCFFQCELGKHYDMDIMTSRNEIAKHLPRRASFPDYYKMSKSGVFIRESIVNTSQVENQYVTPRGFLYNMTRLSGEEWKNEQENDRNNLPPITLESIEMGMTSPKERTIYQIMAANERGRFKSKSISDIELCGIIDKIFVPKYHRVSLYHLMQSEKMDIAKILNNKYYATDKQIKRCLVL